MQPRIRFGLIVGAIGLVLKVCVSAFVGRCGLSTTLLAGGVAGYLAAQAEKGGQIANLSYSVRSKTWQQANKFSTNN